MKKFDMYMGELEKKLRSSWDSNPGLSKSNALTTELLELLAAKQRVVVYTTHRHQSIPSLDLKAYNMPT